MRPRILGLLLLAILPACDGDEPERKVVRPAALAGSWYPAEAAQLTREVDGFLSAPVPEGAEVPFALVAPHAGYRFAGPEQGRIYARVKGRTFRRVFVLGVPHRAFVRGIAFPEATHFATPLGEVPLDVPAVNRLVRAGRGFYFDTAAHAEEHSVEIQLPLLRRAIGEFRLVPMLVGAAPEALDRAAAALRAELGPGDLVVASSDNTHYGPNYGYVPFPPGEGLAERLRALDMGAVERILALDAGGFAAYCEETGATVCGERPIRLLLRTLPAGTKAEMTGYSTSAAATADRTNSVSYVGVAFTGTGWGGADADHAFALRLARESMTRFVTKGERFDPVAAGWEIPAALRENAGAFVTLKVDGRLRGCIGDIVATRPAFEAIAVRAISSAAEDPRFRPVTPEELPRIRIEISVLSPLRPVAKAEEIELGKHGIYLFFDGRPRSVYLPQVAPEQGWNLEETLSNLSEKGGLPPDAWRSPRASFEVFTADVFAEDE